MCVCVCVCEKEKGRTGYGILFSFLSAHTTTTTSNTAQGMPPDDPLGQSTGASVLFGATGGVMEGR